MIRNTVLLIVIALFAQVGLAASGISLQGRILKGDGTPVTGHSVQFRIQIRSPGTEDCLLFQESQTLDMSSSNGMFALTLGQGARSASTVDGGYSLERVFSNTGVLDLSGTYPAACALGTNYIPSPADNRKIVYQFNDGTGWQTVPSMTVNWVPLALNAMQVGGYKSDHLLRVMDASGNPAAAPSLTSAQATELMNLITGSSTQYISPNGGTFNTLPQYAGSPTNPNDLVTKSYVDSSMGSALPDVGTAGTYYKVTTDSKGRVISGATSLVEADIPQLTSAGKVDGGAINAGTLGGSAAINTSGNLITSGTVSANVSSANQLRVYNGAGNYVQFTAPTVSGVLSFKLPGVDGTAGQVLKTDGSGNLSWVTPSAGSVTSVGGNAPISSSGGATPTISITQANSTTDGYLSSTDWNAFNSKLGTSTAFSGDVSGAYNATSVDKIKGTSVSTSGLSSGQFLKFNGSAWVNTALTASDIPGLDASTITAGTLPVNRGGTGTGSFSADQMVIANGTGSALMSFSCTSGQVLSFSAMGAAQCENVNAANLLVRLDGSGKIADSMLPASALTTATSFSGDVSGAYNATSVDKIKGSPVSIATLSSGQILKYNGSAWVNTSLGSSDVTGALGYTPVNKAGDTMSGSLDLAGKNITNVGTLALKGSTSGTLSMTVPATVTSYNLIWPAADGSAGQFLKTDGSGNLSWASASSIAITSINGSSVTAQSFAVPGTSGTAPAWSTNTGTGVHTLNIPMASTASVTAGLISKADYDTFNNKLGTTTSFAGDVSGAYDSTSVDKIKGAPLSIASLSSGNFLKYNGSAWVNASLGSSDVTGALGYTPVNRAGDTMSGALDLGGNDLKNTGNIEMASSKNFLISNNASDPGGLTAADKGRFWFNSSTNQLKYYDGSSVQALGVAGAGITNFNGSTVSSQSFATPGTSGTAPAWSTNTGTGVHTLNVPMASGAGVTAGLISKTDYDAFNNKLGTSTSFSGDVSGAYNATSVDKIKAAPVSISSLSSGNFLKYNGSAWVNSNIAAGDITSGTLTVAQGGTGASSFAGDSLVGTNTTGTALQSVTCAQNQVLSFDAAGKYGCYSLSTLAGGTYFANGGNSFAGAATLGTNDNNSLALKTANTVRMTLDTAGNVGIGTASPGAPLDVKGEIRMSGATSGYAGFKSPATGPSVTWTLPTADGSAGQFLKTDGSGNLSWASASSVAITSLNGSTVSSQSFAAPGTSGTAPAWSTNTGTGVHTLNIPMASTASVTAGLISKTDYDTFNTKLGTSTSFSGDVSGTYNATSVDKIKAAPLSIASLSSGNFLKYNGSAWVNASLGSSDITGALGYTPVNKAGDTMSGSLDLAGKNITNVGTLALKGSTSGTLSMTVPATVTSYTLNWPAAVGSANQVLSTDASGNLTWATVASATNTFVNGGNSFGVATTLGTNDNQALNFETYGTARMTIDTAGKVGIGTASPTTLMHLNVNQNSSTSLLIENTTNGAASAAVMTVKSDASNGSIQMSSSSSMLANFQNRMQMTTGSNGLDLVALNAAGDIRFYTGGLSTAEERIRLTSAGKLGIGTTSPGAPLDVKGEIRMSGTTSGYAGFKSPAAGPSVTWTLPTADGSAGQFLKTDGAGNLSWATSATPGDATYAAKGIVQFNTDAATSGISVASGVATVNSGTGANQIVKLDASSKLPAVDGSALTNLNANNISSGTLPISRGGTGASTKTSAFDALSPNSAKGDITVHNGTNNISLPRGSDGQVLTTDSAQASGLKWANAATGTVTSVTGGTGLTGGTITSVGTLNVDVGTGANQIVQLTAASKLPAVDGSALTNLNANNITSGTLPISRGGTGAGSLAGDNLVGTNTTGTALQAVTCAQNQVLSFDAAGKYGCYNLSSIASGTYFANGGNSFAGAATLGTNDNNTLGFKTNNSTRMTIDTAGNVGIGTTSPSFPLHVLKASAANDTNTVVGWIQGGTDGTLGPVGLDITVHPSATGSNRFVAMSSGDSGGIRPLILNMTAGGGFGKVGVGTSSPSTIFDVSGTIKVANGGESCSAGADGGMIRYSGGNLQFCNGSSWQTLGVSGAGLTNLNGLTASTQSFVTATTGTDFTISSSGSAHTFAIPSASSSARGLLTSTDWSTFNNKLGTSTSFSGDVSGTYNATSVDKIKAAPVSISSLSSGNYLKYNGSAWVNASLGSSDITGALGYTPVNKAGDTMSGSLDLAGKNITNVGTLALKGSTSGTLSMTVPATVTSYTLNWPAAVGSANQVLSTDASGNLSWATVASATNTFVNGGNSFGGAATLGTNDNNSLAFKTNNSTRMTISNSGNIGIGRAPSTYNLDVNGDMRSYGNLLLSESSSSPPGGSLVVSKDPGATSGFNPLIAMERNGGAYTTLGLGYWANGTTDSAAAVYSPSSDLIFGSGTTAATERMRITTAGKVGIGTTAPALNLEVSKAVNAETGIQVTNTSTGASAESSLEFKTNTGLIGGVWAGSSAYLAPYNDRLTISSYASATGVNIESQSNTGWIAFLFGPSSSEKMRITSAGNVGIGTNNPGAALDVKGEVRMSGATSGYAGFKSPATGPSVTWTLPTADGSSGQFLKTDGAGNLSWASASTAAITSLNGLTAATQTFAIGTSGNSPNFSSATATHTLNIPMASTASVTAGLISKTDYDTFNNKLGTSTSFSGDVSGTYNATSVDKIKAAPVSISSLSSGNFLKYNGSAWVNTSLASADITGALGYTPVNRAGDTMSGALNMNGQNITNLGSESFKGTTSGTLTITVPATVTSYTMKWPSAVAASNGQVLSSDTSGNLSWTTVASASNTFVNGGNSFSGTATLGTNDNNLLAFETNNTTRMTIGATGKVGIGGNFTPGYILDVGGNGATANTSYDVMRVAEPTSGQGLVFGYTENAGATGVKTSYVTTVSSDLQIGTSSYNNAISILNSNSNVGIAISNPSYRLDVAGSGLAANTTYQVGRFAEGSTGSGIFLGYTVNSGGTAPVSANVSTSSSGVNLSLGPASYKNAIYVLDSNGNVGIGTTSPAMTFDTRTTSTSTASATMYNAGSLLTANPASASSSKFQSSTVQMDFSSGAASSPSAQISGVSVTSNNNSAGTVGISDAIWASSVNNSTGTISTAHGISASVNNASTGVISNGYGVYTTVSNPSGTVTNGYGLYIDTIAAGNKWSIFANDSTAPSYFAGKIGIGTNSPNTSLDINGAESMRGMAAPAVSMVGQGRIYFDSTANKYKVSENGGAYVNLVGGGGTGTVTSITAGTGLTGGTITTTGTLAVDVGTGANQIVQLNASSKLPAVDGSQLTNLSAAQITAGTLPVTRGGTGLVSGTSGGIPYFSSATTMASSGALTANGVVLGGGAGASPTATAVGTADQVLRVPAGGGAPAFGAIDLSKSAAVTGTLAIGNGGTGLSAIGANGTILTSNGTSAAWSTPTSLGYWVNGGNSFGANAALGTNDNFTLGFETNNSTRMTIDTSGNVGIGTTSPSYPLVVSRASASSVVQVNSGTNDATVWTNGLRGVLALQSSAGAVDAKIKTIISDSGSLKFGKANDAWGVETTHMTIDNSGNVGIGTTSPDSPLHIRSSTPWIHFDRQGGYDWQFGIDNGSYASMSDLIFRDNSAGSVRMIIKNTTGAIGIGTTTPSATNKLEVAGSVRATSGTITGNYSSVATTTIDFSTANVITTSASCGAMTLSGMQDGGSYTLIVTGSTSGTCTFTHTGVTGWKFSPTNAATDTASSGHTVYTFLKAGANVYISWITGMR